MNDDLHDYLGHPSGKIPQWQRLHLLRIRKKTIRSEEAAALWEQFVETHEGNKAAAAGEMVALLLRLLERP